MIRCLCYAVYIGYLFICCHCGTFLDPVTNCTNKDGSLTVNCPDGIFLYGRLIGGINKIDPCKHSTDDCTGLAALLKDRFMRTCLQQLKSECTIDWSSSEKFLLLSCDRPLATYIHLYDILCSEGEDQIGNIRTVKNISATSGYIHDPEYPRDYSGPQNCSLQMKPGPAHCVVFQSVFLQLRDKDRLQITSEENKHGLYTADDTAISETVCADHLSVRLYTDESIEGPPGRIKHRYGFLIGYTVKHRDNVTTPTHPTTPAGTSETSTSSTRIEESKETTTVNSTDISAASLLVSQQNLILSLSPLLHVFMKMGACIH